MGERKGNEKGERGRRIEGKGNKERRGRRGNKKEE